MKLTTTIRKKFRVRNKLKKVATTGRLRLCISRSTKNISAQIIDDNSSKTLISASSSEKDIKMAKKNKSDSSALVAEKLAKIAKEKMVDLNAIDLNGAVNMVKGSAVSMGMEVIG